jgi:hypothetical protein
LDPDESTEVLNFMKENYAQGIKYNYSIDPESSESQSYETLINMS